MNKKNKVLLAIAALTSVTAVAATTSTLAWFTTTRNVTVNFSNLKVKTGNGDLKISYLDGGTGSTTTAGEGTTAGDGTTIDEYSYNANVVGITSKTSNGVDVSGNGTDFYSPTWNATTLETEDTNISNAYGGKYTASSISKLTSASNKYVSFKVSLWNTGNKKVDVFINNGTTISSGSSTDGGLSDQAALGTRIAILNASGNLLSMWQGGTETTADGYKYVTTGKDGSTEELSPADYLYGAKGFKLADATALTYTVATDADSYKTGTINSWHTGNSFSTINVASDGDADGTYIGRLDDEGKMTLTINLWFEGTSAHIVGSLEDAIIGANINFVSVDVA